MKYYPCDAIIIKGMSYGESHRIFTLFSKEEGRFSAIARGVKKQKSTLKGHLQLGNRCDFLLYHGKTLDTVSQAVAKETYPHIRLNPKGYVYACYLMELLQIALPEREANESVFALTVAAFSKLKEGQEAFVTRYFEIHLLKEMGYESDFRHCIGCGKPLKEGFLSPRFEGIVCEKCSNGYPVSPQTIYALDYYQRVGWEEMNRLRINEDIEKNMAKVTRHMLQYHLGKKLKSISMLEDI